MKNNILNRWVLIVTIITLSVLFLINDIIYYKSDSEDAHLDKTSSFLFDNKVINLGLDLQGGKEFRLAPKIDKWIKQLFDSQDKASMSNERKDLFEALGTFYKNRENFKENYRKRHPNQDTVITFTLDDLNNYLKNTKYKSSISDLFNGKNKEGLYKDLKEALETNINIIRNRIDDKGVIEPVVRIIGDLITLAERGS